MPPLISRRRFLKVAATGVLGLGLPAIGASAYVTRVEPYLLDITRLTLPLPGLDPAFHGFTIVQASDWHLGAWMRPERMREIVGAINALQPDLIALTGDFVSRLEPDTARVLHHLLRALRAREGVAATLGNHDHWTAPAAVYGAIIGAGHRCLANAALAVRRGGAALYVAGVDDIWEGQHDLARALDGIPDGAPTILLAHEPDYADEVALTGRVSLQLSGHSHGGQVRLPGRGALILPRLGRRYDQGLYDVGGMALYVNRGVGMVAPYVRFNCPPEITHFTLASPDLI